MTDCEAEIRILSGVSPASRCGIYDYSECLANALRPLRSNTSLMNVPDWRVARTSRIAASLFSYTGVVHIQFPSQAMQRRFAPHLILCSAPFAKRIVTFHEFSRMTWRGKLLALPSMLVAHRVIASHEGEAEAIVRTYPFVQNKLSCIPIGSNIPAASEPAPRKRDLCFFGMIGDNPQVRGFLRVARSTGLGTRSILIGHADLENAETTAIVEQARDLGIELAFNRSKEEVAALLSSAKVALLPYKDGISERRGSALAAMANGALVVTTPPGEGRAEVFEELCLMADLDRLAETTLHAVAERESHRETVQRARAFAARRCWSRIAAEHLELYGPHRSPVPHQVQSASSSAESASGRAKNASGSALS